MDITFWMNDRSSCMIIYEQPLNELTRILLKLEYLLQMGAHLNQRSDQWDSHTSLIALCDILNLLDRPDLRSKFTKEIQRFVNNLAKLQHSPDVNQQRLSSLLSRLDAALNILLSGSGRLAQPLRDDEFLNSVRQHLMSPAGTCNFDLPIYHYWCAQAPSLRIATVEYWQNQLNDIKELVRLLLELIRDSGHLEKQQAVNGFYQMTLDPLLPCQLIRVAVAADAPVFPEMSAGKHRLCVYFMAADFHKRPVQSNLNLNFQLALCII